jgi:hypothetical protein
MDGAQCEAVFASGKQRPEPGAPALTVGIVRDHRGTLYVALCTGSPGLQGIWRISPDRPARRIAALPADGISNEVGAVVTAGALPAHQPV